MTNHLRHILAQVEQLTLNDQEAIADLIESKRAELTDKARV